MKKISLLLLFISLNSFSQYNSDSFFNKQKIDSLFNVLDINNEYMGTISVFLKIKKKSIQEVLVIQILIIIYYLMRVLDIELARYLKYLQLY